jgi:uridylate kinase
MMKYKRILLKLSGGALSGSAGFGFEKDTLDYITDEIIALKETGVELALLVGGGNIFRGRTAEDWGIERAEADNIGMLATVINSLVLRGALTAKGLAEPRVMTSIPMNAVAEPYIRLRAIHHLEKKYTVIFAGGIGQPYVTTDYPAVQRAIEIRADAVLMAKFGTDGVFSAPPKENPNVKRYKSITYDEVLKNKLEVADQSAFILARDYRMPIHIFDFFNEGSMQKICCGIETGTSVSSDCQNVFY